jgi:flavin reductase (DIM6/NTAB) family NADH-FMN oxidoreductase RutF
MTAPSNRFEPIRPEDIRRNTFSLIAEDWFLLTAGTVERGYNTMTASWGGLGELWRRKVAFVFVRPQRYTLRFMESNDPFTMSFFPEEHREALNFCGTHSGEHVDKAARSGLTPITPADGATAFEEAGLILVCRKLHSQDLDSTRFIDPEIESLYPEKGYHRMYVGEITGILRKPASRF